MFLSVLVGLSLVLMGFSVTRPAAQELAVESVSLSQPVLHGNPKLASSLTYLLPAQGPSEVSALAEETGATDASDQVRVIVESQPGQAETIRGNIGSLGQVEDTYSDLMQVLAPINNLEALAAIPAVKFIRHPYPIKEEAIVSQGVGIANALSWHNAGYTGAGVKIAVLDRGFGGYTSRVASGELPAGIITKWFAHGDPGPSSHGTACAEIIYDIAPGAQLYLVSFGTEVEFGNAVDWLIAQGVNIISHSLGWPASGPGDGTGPICQIVDKARAAGILWVNSAGNYAQRSWQGFFSDTDNDGSEDFVPGDEGNTITVSKGDFITGILKWDDPWGRSTNDYDLLLFDNNNNLLVASEDTQDGNDDPLESVEYTAPNAGSYYFVISKNPLAAPMNLRLVTFEHNLQFQTAAGSITVPADSPNALAVGAVAWSSPDTLEYFSSQGPTKDGRTKPDLVAPDGVNTVTFGPGGFFGTSAASPLAAGAAALVKQRSPTYGPAQIQSALEASAVDLGTAGKDTQYGAGRLYLVTPAIAPIVVTQEPSNVSRTTARLNGELTEKGAAGTINVSFEWGTTEGGPYPSSSPPQAKTSPGTYFLDLTGLTKGTTYYFRTKAVGNGASYGGEKSFATLADTVTFAPISEAQSQYFRAAPILSTLRFEAQGGLNSGWYQMDSYAGAWTSLFSNVAGTSWTVSNWTVPGFASLSQGTHTVYFKASDDNSIVGGTAGEWRWQFFKDTVAPSGPVNLSSSDHTLSAWSGDNTVAVIWGAATDATSGIDGYSILWDTNPGTLPDAVADISSGVTSAISTPLADGNSHYFHIRTLDRAGNWQISASHIGPFYIAANSPALSNATVAPGSGVPGTTFAYSVTYTDFANQSPGWITIQIDGQSTFSMMRRAGQDGNYANGEIYEYVTSGLDAGSHSYRMAASNGKYSAIGDTTLRQGPEVVTSKRGDANEDGYITMGDVTKLELIILGLAPMTSGCDANGDGVTNMGDVTRIELMILGLVQ